MKPFKCIIGLLFFLEFVLAGGVGAQDAVSNSRRNAITHAVEIALKEGKGQLTLSDEKSNPANDRVFSELNACLKCGLSFGELSPPHFSFNNPLGMCPDCNGLGTKPEMECYDMGHLYNIAHMAERANCKLLQRAIVKGDRAELQTDILAQIQLYVWGRCR